MIWRITEFYVSLTLCFKFASFISALSRRTDAAGKLYGMTLLLFRQYFISRFFEDHYGDVAAHIDHNSANVCCACMFVLQQHYLEDARPSNACAEDESTPASRPVGSRRSVRIQQANANANNGAASSTPATQPLPSNTQAPTNPAPSPTGNPNLDVILQEHTNFVERVVKSTLGQTPPGAQSATNPTTPAPNTATPASNNTTAGKGTNSSGKKRTVKTVVQYPIKKR